MPREIVGQDSLDSLAGHLFDGQDPTAMFFTGSVQQVTKEGGAHVLRLRVPFTDIEHLSLFERGDELTIQTGSYRRNFILPRILVGANIGEAKLEGDSLRITFRRDETPVAR